jgi:hypothetical protein
MTEPETDEEKAQRLNNVRYELVARIYGYNELAKLATNLGEKVYARLMRQEIERVLAADYGVTITRPDDLGPTVLTLGQKPPFILFHARDIEMMRQAVAAYDAQEKGREPLTLEMEVAK